MTRDQFIEEFGEDPEDVLGPDWDLLNDIYSESNNVSQYEAQLQIQ